VRPPPVLGHEGYRLALLARRADRIEALAAELGDTAVAITADVTDRDSWSPPRTGCEASWEAPTCS
jgi:NADP-dependent 3-hydroxy acid dehydrogenase YdfG